MSTENTQAKYDKQESQILNELEKGETRETLYKKYGYSSVRTMDAFFRRRGFIIKNGKYIKRSSYRNNMLNQISGEIPFRAQMIAEKFKKDGILADPTAIAATFGFENYIEMNTYMRNNNMFYNSSTKTYEPHYTKAINTMSESPENNEKISLARELIEKDSTEDGISKYYSLLSFLYENKERLIDLLSPALNDNTPKRYLIPGSKKVKSIYLSKGLSAIIDDFSYTKNISIRELVEGAVIEYLIKYGYKSEIEILMSQK